MPQGPFYTAAPQPLLKPVTCLSWGSTLYLLLLDPGWFLSVHFPSLLLSLRAALLSSTWAASGSVPSTNWTAKGAVLQLLVHRAEHLWWVCFGL